MHQNKLLPLLTGAVLVSLTLALLALTDLIPAVGTWYSYDPSLRLQSEAFLRGELAVQPVPYGHLHDWAWGRGMQQVWGLGVPLLQLPFQLAGKLVNGYGCPDRLIFLLFYIGVAGLFWLSLDSGDPSPDPGARLRGRLLSLPILLYAFLNHALINMIQGKFEAYEEVIAYGFLWALLLFALLAFFQRRPDPRLYLGLCLLAGFALNLRPTIGAYGGMTFVLAFWLAWRHRLRCRYAGLALFLLGIGFFLLMNTLRFGSPFEAGHNLGLSNDPFSNYIVKFDNPMTWAPFASAAQELLSGLFFLDLHKFQALNEWFPGKALVPRLREINFKPFYAAEFLLLLLAWSLPLLGWLRRRQKPPAAPAEPLIAIGLAWSGPSAILLFFFYARWPGLVSRYLVDFSPAFIIAIASLYRYLLSRPATGPIKLLAPAGLTALTIAALALSEIIPIYDNPRTVATLDLSREKLGASRTTSGPQLPREYRCGDRLSPYGIPYNNSGWDLSGDCGVNLVSTHFLPPSACLAITLAPLGNTPDWMNREYSDQEIDVRMGIEQLARRHETTAGAGKTITFCRPGGSRPAAADSSSPEMVSIRWLNLRRHPKFERVPRALMALQGTP